MDRTETLKILSVLKAAYPNFYKDKAKTELEGIVNLWEMMFKTDTYDIVSAAVMAFIATDTKGFPPVIGVIKDKMSILTNPQQMTEMEAWQLVSKALSNSGYESELEFKKLPQEIQYVIGAPSQLKEWASMDIETVQSVIQSNFMRSFKAKQTSIKEYMALPGEVKNMLGSISGKMKMPELTTAERVLLADD